MKEIFFKELMGIHQALSTLDSLATCPVAEYLDSEDLKELEDLIKELERLCPINSTEKFMALHIDIHKKLQERVPRKKGGENTREHETKEDKQRSIT